MRPVGFTPAIAQQLLGLLDPEPVEAPEGSRYVRSRDVYFVKTTSTDATDGRYPGQRYSYNPITSSLSAEEDVWVANVNGEVPDTSIYYSALRSGVVDGVTVWIIIVGDDGGVCCHDTWGSMHVGDVFNPEEHGLGAGDKVLIQAIGSGGDGLAGNSQGEFGEVFPATTADFVIPAQGDTVVIHCDSTAGFVAGRASTVIVYGSVDKTDGYVVSVNSPTSFTFRRNNYTGTTEAAGHTIAAGATLDVWYYKAVAGAGGGGGQYAGKEYELQDGDGLVASDGAWDGSRTYAAGDRCTYTGRVWNSEIDDNLGNTPGGAGWLDLGAGSFEQVDVVNGSTRTTILRVMNGEDAYSQNGLTFGGRGGRAADGLGDTVYSGGDGGNGGGVLGTSDGGLTYTVFPLAGHGGGGGGGAGGPGGAGGNGVNGGAPAKGTGGIGGPLGELKRPLAVAHLSTLDGGNGGSGINSEELVALDIASIGQPGNNGGAGDNLLSPPGPLSSRTFGAGGGGGGDVNSLAPGVGGAYAIILKYGCCDLVPVTPNNGLANPVTTGTGGTGANLSATGPGVLVQQAIGGPLVVAPQLPPDMGGTGANFSGTGPGMVVQAVTGGALSILAGSVTGEVPTWDGTRFVMSLPAVPGDYPVIEEAVYYS